MDEYEEENVDQDIFYDASEQLVDEDIFHDAEQFPAVPDHQYDEIQVQDLVAAEIVENGPNPAQATLLSLDKIKNCYTYFDEKNQSTLLWFNWENQSTLFQQLFESCVFSCVLINMFSLSFKHLNYVK